MRVGHWRGRQKACRSLVISLEREYTLVILRWQQPTETSVPVISLPEGEEKSERPEELVLTLEKKGCRAEQ